MKASAIALLIVAGFAAPALAGNYSLDNRPSIVFPGSRAAGIEHRSPYPMSRRAAAIWTSDACWRDCTGQAAWRFATCYRAAGAEACRVVLDADDRACLRTCRTRGGPLLNITD